MKEFMHRLRISFNLRQVPLMISADFEYLKEQVSWLKAPSHFHLLGTSICHLRLFAVEEQLM